MWNDPVALNRLSRLILVAALLFAIWTVGRAAAEKLAPFWQVSISGASREETRVAAKQARGALKTSRGKVEDSDE